jgi:hypothetical protein
MICPECSQGKCAECKELEMDPIKMADSLPDFATAHYCPCQHVNHFKKKATKATELVT